MSSEEQIRLTTTNTLLLDALRETGNNLAWQRFCERYRPTIVRYGQSTFRLDVHDAEDAAQLALAAFHEGYLRGDYDRDRGRLRKWLFGIASNQMRQLLRKKARQREAQAPAGPQGADLMQLIPDEAALEQAWEREWRQAVYQQCMVEIRRQFNNKTVEAFELFAKDGAPAREVAEQLGITANAVYLAKQHILKRIRELLPVMEGIY